MDFFQVLDKIKNDLVQNTVKNIRLQGHTMTGRLEKSIEVQVVQKVDIFINLLAESYGIPLNTGVKPSRIPFSKGSGAKTSEYIKGLQRFAKIRMRASDKEALSIAFAIAKKHKKEGMPSRGSFRYSKNGKRTRFFDDAVNETLASVDAYLNEFLVSVQKEFEL